VNKVATLRNSRGGQVPDVVSTAQACVSAGAGGITVHPRADGRHITTHDVRVLNTAFAGLWGESLEFNIEGDPRPEWMALVSQIRPAQATLVPVRPAEITSQAGWNPAADSQIVTHAVAQLRPLGIRVSVFVDPTQEAVRFAKACGADRVEPRVWRTNSDSASMPVTIWTDITSVSSAISPTWMRSPSGTPSGRKPCSTELATLCPTISPCSPQTRTERSC
jgi:hypothetical protein